MRNLLRKLLIPVLTLCLVLAVTGCGGETGTEVSPTPTETAEVTPAPTPEEKAYSLDICLGMEWYTLDPTYVNDSDTATYVMHLFEGLMKYVPSDSEGQIGDTRVEYGMAEGYTVSEDGLTYTFTLRPDACWSDGEPVKAGDFVYAWQRLLSSDEGEQLEHATGAQMLSGIVKNASAVLAGKVSPTQLGVTAADDRTLMVELEQPCSYFPKLCASPCLVPLRQDVIEQYGGNWTDADKIVVNGPYTIADWVHDDYLSMEQNPYYYDWESLGPAAIVWHFSDGEEDTLREFRAGSYDFIGTFPEEETQTLKDEGVCRTLDGAGTYYLYFNTDVIADWRVRAAMVLSVDRDALVESLPGEETAATGFVASGIQDSRGRNFSGGASGVQAALYSWLQGWYPDCDLTTYEGRCALAKELYQEALDAGAWYRSYTVTYCYNASTTNRMVAKQCQQDWAEVLGLQVNLSVVDRDQYGALLENGNFGVAYLTWMSDFDDAQNFLSLMDSNSVYNYGGWTSAAFVDLLTQINTTRDALERDELQYYAETQMFSMGGFPVCPIYFFEDTCCISDALTGVGYSPFGYCCFRYAQLND